MPSSKLKFEIPPQLKEAIQSGRAVLFLGAGASMEAKNDKGARPPSSEQLGQMLSEKFYGKSLPGIDLMQISEMTAQVAGQSVVNEFIRSHLKSFKPSEAHNLLPTFRWHTIATTNYDVLVEDAYGEHSSPVQSLLPFVKDSEPVEFRRSEVTNPLDYLKLHGCVEHAHDSEIPLVLDSSHYERYRENRDRLFGRLEHVAHELPFVFIGYKIGDPHIASMIHRLDKMGRRPEYYIVTPNVASEVSDHWASRRIVVIDAKFGAFIKALDSEVLGLWRRVEPSLLAADLPIRRHFTTTIDPTDLLVRSLENDFSHVHKSMPIEHQKPSDFYRGYDAGFSALVQDLDARRGVADDLLYEMINDQEADGHRFYILRGAAGTGKTVTLKRVALDTAIHFDAPVLWLEESGRLRTDIINEFCSLINNRIYIFVDQACTRLEELNDLLREAKLRSLRITVVAAERDSTWNTNSGDFEEKWKVNPFSIGQLSTGELKNLIQRLKSHSALGVLTPLTPEEQIRAFETADRHLLVALHEVTEGKPFEEIVFNECQSLKPAKAQQLYLDICTLNQFGAPVRAGVIQRVSSIPFNYFQENFFKPLEGVVVTQDNKYTGDFEYRARHPRIASLVFKQAFSSDVERISQLIQVISSLDEGYRTDQTALKQLVSAHNLLHLISDIEWGRELFDRVIQNVGDKWYLWHQRAVFEMQHDNGSLDDADQYAEKALELQEKQDSVLHTYAEIARTRARRANNGPQRTVFRRQARERLAKIRRKSSYTDSSRCKILLDELTDAIAGCNIELEESTDAVSSAAKLAKQSITEALSSFPSSAEIRSLESQFFSTIQDNKKARVALERAWSLSSRNASTALSLARVYGKEGNIEAVERILNEAIERHPEDYAANFAMARLIVENHENIDRAAYFLGRSYRKSDRNYVARYLHAQYHVVTNKGKEAVDLFEEVDAIAPADFKPSSTFDFTAISKRIGLCDGRVVTKENSYLFARCSIYPSNIYANYSNSKEWDQIHRNMRIGLNLGFCRKGPVGLNIVSQ